MSFSFPFKSVRNPYPPRNIQNLNLFLIKIFDYFIFKIHPFSPYKSPFFEHINSPSSKTEGGLLCSSESNNRFSGEIFVTVRKKGNPFLLLFLHFLNLFP
ncbi:hypothetical protein MTR67_022883 [Solanum verrucosum]|uniref:Uncharacterized protein n=1 Tax=Solanum verrucosum TaxID=315347 RepID=A0AAF0TY86_SOLVR|nr:hypothetical protein MTR67_022883 [Solanum verrucosum]